MGVTLNNKSTTERPPWNRQQPKPRGMGVGLSAFYWHQIFALLIHYGETKKKAPESQIVRAKENLKLSHGGKKKTRNLIRQRSCWQLRGSVIGAFLVHLLYIYKIHISCL